MQKHGNRARTLYAIRLKANARLQATAQSMVMQVLNPNKLYESQIHYGEFQYKAKSWDCARCVVVKMERLAGDLHFQFTYIVTNMTVRPKSVHRFYFQRRHMENFIKEEKNRLARDTDNQTIAL